MNSLTKTLKKHRMGLRIIKTGIAVTVCVAISYALKLNQPFFAVVATVMSMGKSIDISFRSGKNKVVGAIVGVAVGYGFASISPANAGLCGVGIIVTLYVCQLLRLKGAATLSCFLFASMMFLHSFGTSMVTWRFAAASVVDSIVGIAIALVVNLLVMPPNYAEEIKNARTVLHERIQEAILNARDCQLIDIHAVETAIEKLAYNVNLYISEIKFLRWNDKEVFGISCKISTYRMILEELKALQVLIQALGESGEPDASQKTVFEYHYNRVRSLFTAVCAPEESGPAAK